MAIWNGASWSLSAPFWYGLIGTTALRSLPNGQMLAVGFSSASYQGSTWSFKVYEGNGTLWNYVASVPAGSSHLSNSMIRAVDRLPNGSTAIGGAFADLSGVVSRGIARHACPVGLATATPYGSGCYDSIATAYEHFATGSAFDLSQSTVQLGFDGQAYQITSVPGAPAFVTPSTPALALTDDSLTAPIVLPFTLPYPGGSTNQIVVGSNGFVYLQSDFNAAAFYGNIAWMMSGAPRLAPMWGDEDPGVGTGGGTVHVDMVGQAVYVTWANVQEYGNPTLTSTFQVALFDDGNVEYRYQDCAASLQVLTGWSPGNGARDPGTSDASMWSGLVCRPESLPLLHAALARPVLGSTAILRTFSVPANSPLGATVLGFHQFNPGIDLGSLGMPSCAQFASAEVFVIAVPSTPDFTFVWSLPMDVSFLGAHIYSQGVAMTAGLNALGFITSNGLDLRLGDV